VVAKFDLRAVEGAIDRRSVELGDETALTEAVPGDRQRS
jgi:hypothetical protein